MEKFNFETFFKTEIVRQISDLVAVRIEESGEYVVYKSRNTNIARSEVINETEFMEALKDSKRPIVLSDIYINI